ncbi:MAG: septal ring lytic transglycosylase RlpA family protein [bacterium]|nr:septal ring lytic transglycosylase RlpA family protein [bacterium]
MSILVEQHGRYAETGWASYYGSEFAGRSTSSGDVYDMHALTAAHRRLPLGTVARVTNISNSRSVTVIINDRGPFKRGRILDLSYGAAKVIGMIGPGTAKVRLEVITWGGTEEQNK